MPPSNKRIVAVTSRSVAGDEVMGLRSGVNHSDGTGAEMEVHEAFGESVKMSLRGSGRKRKVCWGVAVAAQVIALAFRASVRSSNSRMCALGGMRRIT